MFLKYGPLVIVNLYCCERVADLKTIVLIASNYVQFHRLTLPRSILPFFRAKLNYDSVSSLNSVIEHVLMLFLLEPQVVRIIFVHLHWKLSLP